MSNKKIYKNRLSLPIFDNKGIGNGNGVAYIPNVIRGGSAIPIGNNMFLMRGRSHAQGGIDIGRDLEVEGNEVVQNGKFGTKVFSSVPFLRGVSPAERVLRGENPDTVFAAQETWKRVNKVADDGSKRAALGLSLFKPNSFKVRRVPINDFITPTLGEVEEPETPSYTLTDDEKPVGKKVNPNDIGGGRLYNGYAVDNHEGENVDKIGGSRVYKETLTPTSYALPGKNKYTEEEIYNQRRMGLDSALDELHISSKDRKKYYDLLIPQSVLEPGWTIPEDNNYFGHLKVVDGKRVKIRYANPKDAWLKHIKNLNTKWPNWITANNQKEYFDIINNESLGLHTLQDWKDYVAKNPTKNAYIYAPAWENNIKQYVDSLNSISNKFKKYKAFGGRIKAGFGDWLKNAIIGASVAENPAVATASGWKKENGNWVQKPDKNSRQLANNLAELSLFSPTNPITAAIDKTIGLGIKGYRFLKPFIKKNINSSKNIIKGVSSSNDSEIENIFADDKAKKALLKNYYTNKISGKTFYYSIGDYVPNTSKGLSQKVKDDLMYDTVERELRERGIELANTKNKNGELFFPNGEKDYKYLLDQERKEASKLFDDVNVGRYSANDYKQAEANFEGFFDKDKNFISINKDSEMPYVENHEARHLYDNTFKPVREDVLSAAYDKSFENIPNTKYAGDLKGYKYMKDERVTTNRDARDVAFFDYDDAKSLIDIPINERSFAEQDAFIDNLSDEQIFNSVENSNGYGQRFIEYLRDNNLLTKEKANQFREAMKHVGATIPFAFGVNSITNKKQFGGMKLNIFKLGGLSRSKDYGSKDKPYPSVNKNDFAGGGRSYPIPTRADAVDALRLAGLHHRSDVRAKVYAKYPDLRKKAAMGTIDGNTSNKNNKNTFRRIFDYLTTPGLKYLINEAKKPSYKRVAPSWITRTDSPIFYDKNVSMKKGNFGNGRFNGGGAGTKFFEEYNPVEEVKRDTIFIPYETTFNDAFSNARRKGLKEFDFNGKKYNTELGDNPKNYEAGQQRKSLDFIPFIVERKKKNFVSNNEKKFGGKVKAPIGTWLRNYFGNRLFKRVNVNSGYENKFGYLDEFSDEDKNYIRNNATAKDIEDFRKAAASTNYKDNIRNIANRILHRLNFSEPNLFKFAYDRGLNIAYPNDGELYMRTNPTNDRKDKYENSVRLDVRDVPNGRPIYPVYYINREKLNKQRNFDSSDSNTNTNTYEGGTLPDLIVTANRPNSLRRTQPVRVRTERVGNVPEAYKEFRRPNLTQLETRGIGLNMPAYTNPFTSRTTSGTRTYDIGVPTTLDTSRLDSTLSRYGVTPISSSTGVQPNPADVEAVRSGNFKAIDNDRYIPIRTTTEDWVGLGANLLGSIGSYLGTRAMLNRYPMPNKPVPVIAQKLKTRVNINPQLDTIREQVGRLNTSIDNNTSSSRVAQARKQGVMNNAVASRNQLYGQKENAETQLINQDIMNRQRIGLYNNQIFNDYLSRLGSTRQYVASGKINNINNLINGTDQSIQDFLGRIDDRDANLRNFIFMEAAYPNVNWRNIFGNPELARSLGFRFLNS